MKKINLKLLLVLIFSLFAITSFYSCDKPGAKLAGTFWESDELEVKYLGPIFPLPDLNGGFVVRGKMTISFVEPQADVVINKFEIYDTINDVEYYSQEHLHHIAGYTYYGKTLTLFFDSTGFFAGQTWVGTVNKRTMDLRFLGEEIRLNRR
ncbi:MAG: hypothetical protein FWC34_09250 [Bacteroidetes bacterium]|nr:hypothetical protein [Bacteroidota bacterium]MCL2303015.1 hypothetical protein [Lentimicrobiaceae bacterium]